MDLPPLSRRRCPWNGTPRLTAPTWGTLDQLRALGPLQFFIVSSQQMMSFEVVEAEFVAIFEPVLCHKTHPPPPPSSSIDKCVGLCSSSSVTNSVLQGCCVEKKTGYEHSRKGLKSVSSQYSSFAFHGTMLPVVKTTPCTFY